MQIDQEYLKGLLEAFEASDSPDTDIIRLKDLGFNCETDTFVMESPALVLFSL